MEENREYIMLIEKKAENMYRTVNQKIVSLPASHQAIGQIVSKTQIDLTPQESEQLSQYASDDNYVQKQKEDIQELTSLFRDMLNNGETEESGEIVAQLEQHFRPQPGFSGVYRFIISGKKKNLIIKVNNADLQCFFGTSDYAEVELQLEKRTLDEIVNGRMTFQRAFMSGEMKMKGDFKVLRALDQIFIF